MHGIGHFAFSLATEVAVQKLSLLERNGVARDFIDHRVERVIERIFRNTNEKEGRELCKQITKDGRWTNYFHRFFTAGFLVDNEQPVRELCQEAKSEFRFEELLKYLCLPDNTGFKLLAHIDELDYILRDMFHLGFVKIDLNLAPYFTDLSILPSGKIRYPSEWEVLKKLGLYAAQKIYNDPQVKVVEAMYEKLLMKAICDSEIALAELTEWDDATLEARIKEWQERSKHRHRVFREISKTKEYFDDLPKYSFSHSPQTVSCRNLLLTEGRSKRIGRTLFNEIERSLTSGIFKGAYFPSFFSPSAPRVNVVCIDNSQIAPFLREVGRYEAHYKKIQKEQVAQCIWGSRLDRIDFSRYEPVLEKLLAELITGKQLTKANIQRHILHLFYPDLPDTLEEILHPESIEIVMRLLGISIHKFLLENPEVGLFKNDSLQVLGFHDSGDFLGHVQALQSRRVRRTSGFKGISLEYLTYLKKVREPMGRDDQIRKWVFPSTIIAERGDIDVWALHVFAQRRPLVELIECSSTTTPSKELDAIKKLNQNRQILKDRFKRKVEVNLFFNEKELDD